MSTTETVDTELEEELWRVHLGGGGDTVEGEVVRVRKSDTGRIQVAVETPTDDTFHAYFDMPKTGDSTERFVRFLDAYGYDLSNFEHLVGTSVDCSYDGGWSVIVPDPKKSARKRIFDRNWTFPGGTILVLLAWGIAFPFCALFAFADITMCHGNHMDTEPGSYTVAKAAIIALPWFTLLALL